MIAILGRTKWEWGGGDTFVLMADGDFFAQAFENDDLTEADIITSAEALEMLTRREAKLTRAGRAWVDAQEELKHKLHRLTKGE